MNIEGGEKMKKLQKKNLNNDTVVAFGGSKCSCTCRSSRCGVKAKNYERNTSKGILALGR